MFNIEEFVKICLLTNTSSGNPNFSFLFLIPNLTSHDLLRPILISFPSVANPTQFWSPRPTLLLFLNTFLLEKVRLIWEEFEAYLTSDSFPPGNSNPSSILPTFHNSLSGSTTSSSPSLHLSETSNYFLEEFTDELAHITFPPGNDDHPLDAESDLLELEYLLNHESYQGLDSILLKLSTVNDDTYDDPFDFKEEKIKDSKILIDELDLPESNNVLPFLECDLVFYEDFSKVDALSSTKKRGTRQCNMRIDPTKTPKEPTYQVVLDSIALSPLYPAFLITAEVSEIYIHQSVQDFQIKSLMHLFQMKKLSLSSNNLGTKLRDSPAYKTYLVFGTGAVTPKKARKFKKSSFSSKKKALVDVEEPAEKPFKKPKEKPKKAPAKAERSKGIELIRRIHQGKYGVSVPALHKRPRRKQDQYAVSREEQYAVFKLWK
ncbi:hypothetical protein Tco_0339179 [Tanacetum coccineum]